MDVTFYEVLLFAHIAFVIAWLGGGMLIQVLALRARGVGGERMVELLGDVRWLSNRYFIPVSLLTVALGFALVAESSGLYELGQTWIVLGLAGYVLTFLTGSLYLGPESGRISELAEQRGPVADEVQARLGRLFVVARIDLAVLLLIVLDMVVKPGL